MKRLKMMTNPQSPFDPFHLDPPREEGSWLIDYEALRPRQGSLYRGLTRVVVAAALAGGLAGLGWLWFAIP
jgi:hypothetical protein